MNLETHVDQKALTILLQLQNKLIDEGQNLSCHLEGLYFSDYLKYWDYIRLDTLLSLQSPKTAIPDEIIFIVYHQIAELYFRLITWELEQMTAIVPLSPEEFLNKITRINRYYSHLINSFDITTEGMSREQFMKFRTSLTPASGFQSIQYRLIEVYATDLVNLLAAKAKASVTGSESTEELFEKIYWKEGAINTATRKKDISLIHFEEKYNDFLIEKVKENKFRNIWRQFEQFFSESEHAFSIIREMKEFDVLANIQWPLSHYRSAVRHLQREHGDVQGTGGTNWRKYLPPRYQKIIFFPDLWTNREREDWGKVFITKLASEVR